MIPMGNLSDDELKDLAQRQLAEAGAPERDGVYRHYKGGLYTVVAVSLHEETLDVMVTYRSNKKGTFWTRTLKNFTERVLVPITLADGTAGELLTPRFRREED
jgi:hypothetical protein